MGTLLTYLVEYESDEGDIRVIEVTVDYQEGIETGEYHDSALDENARRFIIGGIMQSGGRVTKIKRTGV